MRKIPVPDGGRVESGAVQFAEDWPGYFLRGDECARLSFEANRLEGLLDALQESGIAQFSDTLLLRPVVGMLSDLQECLQGAAPDVPPAGFYKDWWLKRFRETVQKQQESGGGE